MRKSVRKRATIIILVAALLIGATGAIIWKLSKSSNDVTDSFVLLSEGFTDRKVMDEASALAAIDDVAEALGLEDVNQELEVDQVNNILGHTYYKFQQMHMGLPVYGKSVVVAADECGQALMLSGNIAAVTAGVPVKPTVTSEEIIASIESYVLDHFSCPDRSQISVAPFDADELTIFPANDSFVLSYMIPVCFDSAQDPGYYELVVSAESGSILYACPMLYEEVGYMASDIDRKSGFPIVKADDGYYLWDAKDHFFVFNLNYQESKYDLHNIWGQVLKDENQDPYTISQWFKGEFVLSDNEIFGDTPAEQEKDFEAGARLLLNAKAASSFFKELGFSNDTRVFLYYRDGYDGGNNALGGMLNSHIGVISMGANTGVDCIDAICHEFTHFVSRSIVTWSGSNETSSISEGLSDIFGEIMEAQIKGQEIDWLMHDTRSISSPGGNYITDYTDYTDELDCHYASTLVSHAAYLMWKGIDGSDAFEPLSTEELANLFYETLYTLPSDCTFSQFRALVQNTAEYQNLSTKQQLCIANAFFQVGITSAAMPVVKDHLSIDIYGIDGLPYSDYTLHVRHNKTENTYDGETVKAAGITFPESGEYQLCVVDNANTDNQTTVTVLAVEHGGAKVIPIFTECGVSKPVNLIGTNIEGPGADVSLLSNDPFEAHKTQFKLCEYEITGGIQEHEGRYSTYTILPNIPTIAILTDDFGHNGTMTQLTVEKQEARGGQDEYITINFDFPNGGGHHYGLNVGKDWDGESVYCYILHRPDTDYLVIESLLPTSSAVGEDTYYIGTTDGTRTESIRIINLNDFSELQYTLEYNMGYKAYTILEQDSNKEKSQYLYCKDGENYKYGSGFESLYTSFDDAINHIQKKLSAYGLENRVAGTNTDHFEDDEATLLFTEHRNGVSRDIPLDSISDVELHDTMILGLNPLLSIDYPENSLQSDSTISIIGAWDSDNGDLRLVFSTTGTDFAVTTDGIKNADGSVDIINLKEGERVHGSYIISGNSMTIAAGLQETDVSYSCTGDILTVGEMMFHPIDRTLINQLVGTWEGNGGKIYFGERNDMRVYDESQSGSDSGFYAVLSESEVIISIDGDAIRTIPYSVSGNCLNFNGALLYKNGTDSSYSSTQSLKETLCGTWIWENGSFQDYYVFQKDGTYQYYPTESLYQIGQPAQDGFYEIQDAKTIYLYPDRSSLPFVIQYDSEKGLECSVGNYYQKFAK